MKNINGTVLATIRKKSITRLETIVMMATTCHTTVGIAIVGMETVVRMETALRIETLRDGDEHADGQNQRTVLMHQFCTQ